MHFFASPYVCLGYIYGIHISLSQKRRSSGMPSHCDNIVILGDLNMELNDLKLIPLIEENSLHNLIRKPTCYKTKNGRYINFILKNKEHSFLMNRSFEAVYSDHHHTIYTILKSTYTKVPPKNIRFRQYKKFSEEQFQKDLINNIRHYSSSKYSGLERIIVTTLDQHAPIKTKIVRGNNKQHINREMRKEIKLRSKLKKIAIKSVRRT